MPKTNYHPVVLEKLIFEIEHKVLHSMDDSKVFPVLIKLGKREKSIFYSNIAKDAEITKFFMGFAIPIEYTDKDSEITIETETL